MGKRSVVPAGARIGAVFGFVFFLIFGLIPGFYFGSSTALFLLSEIIGPVEATILGRIAVVIGAVMGIFCVMAVFIVGGALFGSTVAYLTEAIVPRKKGEKDSSENREGKSEGGSL